MLSEHSNENHGYVCDNYGNVMADSLDDLIYDKFIEGKEKKRKKNSEARNLIKNIIDNEFYSDNSPKDSKIINNNINFTNNINNIKKTSKEENKIEDKNIKRKSLINNRRTSDKNIEKKKFKTF